MLEWDFLISLNTENNSGPDVNTKPLDLLNVMAVLPWSSVKMKKPSGFQFSPYMSILLFFLAFVIKHALACSRQFILFYK